VGFQNLAAESRYVRGYDNARSDFTFVRYLQIAQLHHQQKQKDADRQVFDQEVLPEMPLAQGPSRGQNFVICDDAGALKILTGQ
jgi:hypothetical protein